MRKQFTNPLMLDNNLNLNVNYFNSKIGEYWSSKKYLLLKNILIKFYLHEHLSDIEYFTIDNIKKNKKFIEEIKCNNFFNNITINELCLRIKIIIKVFYN